MIDPLDVINKLLNVAIAIEIFILLLAWLKGVF